MTEREPVQTRMEAVAEAATTTRDHLKFAKRAFVVEFAGTPKAGKSSSVETIRHFFSRMKYKVHVLAERAAVCPIPMKGHLFFNTWCLTAMLAELLENVETETDLIIVDRGLFDTLVWLRLQFKRGEVDENEVERIANFVLLDRWRRLTDLVVLMNVDPIEALNRETKTRITKQTGSIMAESVLSDISAAVEETADLYGDLFAGVLSIDSGDQSELETSLTIAEKILRELEEHLNPEIQVVPRTVVESLGFETGGNFDPSQQSLVIEELSRNRSLIRRADAEADSSLVQLVPCGVMAYGDKAFVFERSKEDQKSDLYGRAVLWKGCHLEANTSGGNLLSQAQEALEQRVAQDLFLSRKFEIAFLGFAWDRSSESSRRHLGLVYRLEITSADVANSLLKKEYRRQRGHSLTASFQSLSEIDRDADRLNLEAWSRAILAHLMHQ